MTCTANIHGTREAYKRHGCSCQLALRAVARYENERRLDAIQGRPRTLPNIGTLRRVQALRALGWSSRDLARRIGVHERNMSRWVHRTTISRRLHDAVCRVYDELADTTGPDTRARRHAERQGWLVPLWWDDDTIDDPTFDPLVEYADPLPPCREDRRANERAEVQRLTELGWTANQIAEHLGGSTRRIVRLRSEAMQAAS